MTNKNYKILLLAVLLLASVLMVACAGGEAGTTSGESSAPLGELTYTVTVKDAFGEPCFQGVAVQFMQDGQRIAMQPCDANGVATKNLTAGEYEVTLAFSAGEENYYYQSATVSAEAPACELTLCQRPAVEPEVILIGTTETEMQPLVNGTTYVELTPGVRNYFLYTPAEAGNFEFSLLGETPATIGHYGTIHYVMEQTIAPVNNNVFTVSIKASMVGTSGGGTNVLVIGVDADSATSCVLGIRRIGDPIKTIEDEPWTIYEATTKPTAFELPAGVTLTDFDFTKEYTVVLNETDGYYHLNSADGPVVYMRLTEDSEYMDCYEYILDHTSVTKYFFDENGTFQKKENYSDCLYEYITCADGKEGVYPLTEDLKYIVQQHGGYQGWWDPESLSYLFKDLDGNPEPGINHEIAWLLMCCYGE